MSDLKLYVSPYACPRVPTIALEETGVPFEAIVVGFKGGEHKRPEYLKLNPKGKVPCLVIDGEPLTENVAILSWLHKNFPEAKLLPETDNDIEYLRQVADLAFCSSTLHPIVSRLRMTHMFVDEPAAFKGVKGKAIEAMLPNAALINQRLAGGKWWYGDQWSVMDAYLFWIWFRLTGAGFSGEKFPNWAAHYERMLERPSVQRMLKREESWQSELEARGMAIPAHPAKPG